MHTTHLPASLERHKATTWSRFNVLFSSSLRDPSASNSSQRRGEELVCIDGNRKAMRGVVDNYAFARSITQRHAPGDAACDGMGRRKGREGYVPWQCGGVATYAVRILEIDTNLRWSREFLESIYQCGSFVQRSLPLGIRSLPITNGVGHEIRLSIRAVIAQYSVRMAH